MNPFEIIKAISSTKKDILENEKDYNGFMVNRGLSYFPDTVIYANEMNIHHTADKKLQFDYLLNSVRPRKRFSPWHKKTIHNDFEYVKEYYGYNNKKTEEALKILSKEQIGIIKSKLNKGG